MDKYTYLSIVLLIGVVLLGGAVGLTWGLAAALGYAGAALIVLALAGSWAMRGRDE